MSYGSRTTTAAKARLLPDEAFAGRRVGLSTGAIGDAWGDWALGVERARDFGTAVVELCALGEATIESLSFFLDAGEGQLAAFGYVSVHAPAREARGRWEDVAVYLARLPDTVQTIVVHPDLVDAAAIECLRPLGSRLCFENMDCTKETGRLPEQLEEVFALFPEATFCLDVAHVWTNDRSLQLGDALLERFGDRLRQVHLSGIDEHAVHRPLTSDDLDLYAPLLAQCPPVPIVLESQYRP